MKALIQHFHLILMLSWQGTLKVPSTAAATSNTFAYILAHHHDAPRRKEGGNVTVYNSSLARTLLSKQTKQNFHDGK